MLVGTKSATRTDMLVDVGMVAGCDNLEVPRHVGVVCAFLSSLKQICSFFDVVLCPNPDVSVYYLCIEVEHSFMLATGKFLRYNTCRSLNSNRIIETTVYSLMNYIHCVFIILTGLLFVTEWKCIPRERHTEEICC